MQKELSVQQIFHETYTELSRFEQIVLQICSVIYEPTDSSTILRCLYLSKIPTKEHLQDYPRKIESCYKKLRKLNLFEFQWQCQKQFIELASRQAVIEKTFGLIANIVKKEMPERKFPLTGADPLNSLRDLRIDLYNNDTEQFHRQLVILLGERNAMSSFPVHPMVTICNNPFDPTWFSTLPVHIQFFALHEIFKYSVLNLSPLNQHVVYLEESANKNDEENLLKYPSFLYILISTYLLQGKISQATLLIEQNFKEIESLGLKGWLSFIKGDNQEAVRHFAKDHELLKELNKHDEAFFTGMEGLFYCLALFKSSTPDALEKVRKITSSMGSTQQRNLFSGAYETLNKFSISQTSEPGIPGHLAEPIKSTHNSINTLFDCLYMSINKGRLSSTLEPQAKKLFEDSVNCGFVWLAMEFAEILARTVEGKKYQNSAAQFREEQNITTIADAIKHRPRWELALEELGNLTQKNKLGDKAGTCRLTWLISIDEDPDDITIIPKEQKLTMQGYWTKGRVISTNRLFHQDGIDFLTDHDKKICSYIKRSQTDRGTIAYNFDVKSALYAMAGHKNIYLDQVPPVHLEIIKGEPELKVSENKDEIKIEFFPPVKDDNFIIIKDGLARLRVIKVSEEHRKVATIIGINKLTVPQKGKRQVLQAIGKTASFINIFSDIGDIDTAHKKTEVDSRIHIQMSPSESGFRLIMLVRPFNNQGPYFKPGEGSSTIYSEIRGQKLQTKRNLSEEENYAEKILKKCPYLNLFEEDDKEWFLPSPDNCLEFINDVREMPYVALEWPQGQNLKLSQSVNTSQCHLKITRVGDWFEVNGELNLNNDKVLDLIEIIASIRRSNSRFVQLNDGNFIALSVELFKCIEQLDACTAEQKEKSLRLMPLSLISLENLMGSDIAIDADKEWQAQLDKIHEVENKTYEIPSTLKAVLRDYQINGFQWMMRLSHWGAGACLADDMGIGKTIQTLAVILAKASKGPSLVVAPTSVCANWQDEIGRFTPTLEFKQFDGSSRNRLLKSLGPFDVFVTSYGMLQQEPQLNEVSWQIVVLDEAQAIKNTNTKRSAAAMSLTSEFKIITTGTPIENNLGELWNLFRFINPGLLGNLKQFNTRFAGPIEKDKDKIQKRKLKHLISPFVLRRMKSQVLKELPARTEVNLYVEFSEDEKALYEALRRQSIEKINQSSHQGQKRIQILAEIMKLRRLCCNPKLILPETQITSSKLSLFEETIRELRSNNHKILVFSQFVGHLSILRESLNKNNISYQYLDGSTPVGIRKKRVDDFQAGIGDVFLISLKAGGVGLNLTAANYVIHMDPWWNPAVEDQASDRAHRIGQQHPVTIYRFITRNTIEEKIIRLHQEKKNLAASLLEGTDLGSQVSIDELLYLLQDIR